MVEVYKIIAHMYVKQIVKVRLKKLMKSWSPDVGQKVTEDAEILHNTISETVRATVLMKPRTLKHPYSTAVNCRVPPTRFLLLNL